MASVEEIHSTLNFDAYEADLRSIQGVWRTIQQAQSKARTTPSYASAYRAVLEKAIARIRDRRTVSPDDAEALGKEFYEFGHALHERASIADISTRRLPSSMSTWLEKWHPAVFAKTEAGINAFFDSPSRDSLEGAKRAVGEQVEAYTRQRREHSDDWQS